MFGLAVSAPKQLSISVEGSSNGCVSFEVDETEPVRLLKERLQDQHSVRWEEYRLVLGSLEVADDATFADYDVADGATLQLEVRKPLWVQYLALVTALLGLFTFFALLAANVR
jgi:hypothetical protein